MYLLGFTLPAVILWLMPCDRWVISSIIVTAVLVIIMVVIIIWTATADCFLIILIITCMIAQCWHIRGAAALSLRC